LKLFASAPLLFFCKYGPKKVPTQFVKRAAGWTAGCLGQLLPARRPMCGVLLYHRTFDDSRCGSQASWNVTPRNMRTQFAGLKERGVRFVSLRDFIDLIRDGEQSAERCVAVTFDDIYENNFTAAVPILKELEIPATFFVTTGYIGSQEPFPFDAWAKSQCGHVDREAWLPISNQSVAALSKTPNMTLGSHTHTHQDFRGREGDFERDLQESLGVLHAYGVENPTFAFPAGRQRLGYISDGMISAARRLGVAAAMTTDGVSPLRSHDGYLIGRFNVFDWDRPRTLLGKLGGWYEWAPRLQESVAGLIG
jgi:peptidoglycan/xylan/chitin deacetylase (PgdA/CDA1 family)